MSNLVHVYLTFACQLYEYIILTKTSTALLDACAYVKKRNNISVCITGDRALGSLWVSDLNSADSDSNSEEEEEEEEEEDYRDW